MPLAVAVAALVVIGTAEAGESARQLAELPGRGRPTLTGAGATLTAVGFVLSVAVYALLGWWIARSAVAESDAVRSGVLVGVLAGLIGGTIRGLFVRDYLADTISRFGLPSDFTSWSLVVFIALSVIASAAGGGALTWLSFRLARSRPSRPRP